MIMTTTTMERKINKGTMNIFLVIKIYSSQYNVPSKQTDRHIFEKKKQALVIKNWPTKSDISKAHFQHPKYEVTVYFSLQSRIKYCVTLRWSWSRSVESNNVYHIYLRDVVGLV